ncbi:hypothetical protein [Micromonospora sp. NPDC004551]|uniref:hypothetical protein n=1 Tax=Micromonospora sp. NPDC004551 TaxID=3154284 RepID=UPI0033AFD01D
MILGSCSDEPGASAGPVPCSSCTIPGGWLDQAGLDRPGNKEIQLQLFWDYQFNLDVYPDFQRYLRQHQPPTLVT